MSSFVEKAAILTFCRILNYGLILMSPIFLTRILDITTYGQYQEFTLYAMTSSTIMFMGIRQNLMFFIPRNEQNEGTLVNQTLLLLFASWSIGLLILTIGAPILLKKTSFDFYRYLAFFTFFFVNFNLLEYYWIAKKRPKYILYYSTVRGVVRIIVIVVASFICENIQLIIKSLVFFEATSFSFSFYFFIKNDLIFHKIDSLTLKLQLKYIIPLGITGVLIIINQQLGRFLISALLGVEALAIYVIGSTQVPILGIIRSAISDSIFPEMSKRCTTDPLASLELWKRANIIYCIIVFPVFFICFWYAETIMNLLFTEKYIAAAPIFKVFLFLMLKQCFEMGPLIRAKNKNIYTAFGNLLAVVINCLLIWLLYPHLGIVGPAIAFIIADIGATIYIVPLVLSLYDISIKHLCYWHKLKKISMASMLGMLALIIGENITLPDVYQAMVGVSGYAVVYILLLRQQNIEELSTLTQQLYKIISRFSSRS